MRKVFCDITGKEITQLRDVYRIQVLGHNNLPAYPSLEIGPEAKEAFKKWVAEIRKETK